MFKNKSLAKISLIVGIVGGTLAAVGVVRGWFVDGGPPADLEIVSARVVDGGSALGQSIDLQLLNSGGKVAFVSAVELEIVDYVPLSFSGQVLSSGTYDVTFPTGRNVKGATVEWPVSQEVRGDEVDRFTLTVGLEEGVRGRHDYIATLRLLYNDGRVAAWSEPLEFRLSN